MQKSLIVAVLFVLLSANLFAQTGVRLVGFDARSAGRGGVSIGLFDSPELMMTNPAGISFLNQSTLNADFSLMAPNLKFDQTLNNSVDGDKNYFPLPNAGYVNKYGKESKWTWGIGMFTEGGMGADFSLKNELYRNQTYGYNSSNGTYYPVKGDYINQSYHSKFAVMRGGLSLAYKINDNFSAGITAQLVYSMMEFRMPFSLSPSIMKGTPNGMPNMTFGQLFAASPSVGGFGYNEVTASADMSSLNVVNFGGKIGLAYKVNDKLSFGLTYSMPVKIDYKNGKATMDMTKQFEDAFGRAVVGFYSDPTMQGVPLDTAMKYIATNFYQMGIDMTKGMYANYDIEVEMKVPQSLGFGMSYRASEKFNLGLDVEWINWANAFDKMTITMSNGDNANINKMMGSNSISMDFPLNWKDAVLIKAGCEYNPTSPLTLRLGYAFGSNPVPEETVFPVFPAIVEHHITVGAGYKFTKNFEMNLAFETALNNKLTGSVPHLVSSEFAGSTSELQSNTIHLSATYGF